MTDKRIRHLPVVDGAAIAGIVSIGDLVRSVITLQVAVLPVALGDHHFERFTRDAEPHRRHVGGAIGAIRQQHGGSRGLK